MDEIYRDLTVQVIGGTGCLFQPACEEFTYVLTAKHNILSDNESVLDKEDIEIISHRNNERHKHVVLDILLDDSEDAAIIIIEKITGWSIDLMVLEPMPDYKVHLFGYPDCREGHTWRAEYKIRQNGIRSSVFEISPEERHIGSITEGASIVGMSGCGVFAEVHSIPTFLIGIEFELVDNKTGSGRLQCLSIDVFDSLAKSNDLPGLTPYHLVDFTSYLDYWEQMRMEPTVTGVFRAESEILINNNVTPLFVKDKFQDALILALDNKLLQRKELWEGVYELMTYKQFITPHEATTAQEVVEALCQNHKIIYTGDEYWAGSFAHVLKKNIKDLKPGAYIIFNSEDKRGVFIYSGDKLKTHIGRVDRTQFNIGEGIVPHNDFIFIHIEYLRRTIESCDSLFSDTELTPQEIKQEIVQILKKSFGYESIKIEK
ncbi:hypothetical protein H7F15_05465 [Pontibacter sp. Tf4]|uniref:ABC-three component system protein n=1 Tax=Pontibacter sp. Tf4 TaxID=2761620 RepID=UPI001629FE47|nr:ABC-three component system protein [Pontibacter sp. Tf4]MBB6610475.1 hypothetical protein [Pontibacter sp. Tf4]